MSYPFTCSLLQLLCHVFAAGLARIWHWSECRDGNAFGNLTWFLPQSSSKLSADRIVEPQ